MSGADRAPSKTVEEAWRRLLVTLVALRGDPKLDALLTEKHPELLDLLNASGGPRPTPDDAEAVQRWFLRKLRGRGGNSERLSLCDKLAAKVRHRAEGYRIAELGRIEEALAQNNGAEEGPLVCCALAKQLLGSRFEGIWISREGPGVYRLGEEQLRVAVQVLDGRLLVHGYFEGDFLHPVRVAIKPFLAEHGPAALRSATDDCDVFGGGGGGSVKEAAAARSRSPRRRGAAEDEVGEEAAEERLPSGWEKKESRSRPGVFYYANEAKGLTQFHKPSGA